MLKRLIEGMHVLAPEQPISTDASGSGREAGAKGRVRENEGGGALGNVDPGEISDTIRMREQGGGGGPVIDQRGQGLIQGGGEANATPTTDQGGSDTGSSGGSQAGGASGHGGGTAGPSMSR